jgi:aryl-alcohol dehydrogenase-like predicted oxidoreductase
LPAAYRGPDADARLAALHTIAREIGATPNQLALAWLLGRTPPIVPIVAASTLVQLDELIGAVDVELGAEARERLDAAGA